MIFEGIVSILLGDFLRYYIFPFPFFLFPLQLGISFLAIKKWKLGHYLLVVYLPLLICLHLILFLVQETKHLQDGIALAIYLFYFFFSFRLLVLKKRKSFHESTGSVDAEVLPKKSFSLRRYKEKFLELPSSDQRKLRLFMILISVNNISTFLLFNSAPFDPYFVWIGILLNSANIYWAIDFKRAPGLFFLGIIYTFWTVLIFDGSQLAWSFLKRQTPFLSSLSLQSSLINMMLLLIFVKAFMRYRGVLKKTKAQDSQSSSRLKAISKELSPHAFFFEEHRNGESRLVVGSNNLSQLKRLFYAVLESFPDSLEVLLKIEEGKNWKRFYGEVSKKTLVPMLQSFEEYIFQDGGAQLSIKQAGAERYITFDEYGILFIYGASDCAEYKKLCVKEGFEERVEKLVSEMPHWKILIKDREKMQSELIARLKLKLMD